MAGSCGTARAEDAPAASTPAGSIARGVPADLGSPNQRAVLAVLLAADGGPMPVERVVGLLWPDVAPARAHHSVQQYVSRLRTALEPDRRVGSEPPVLRTEAGRTEAVLAAVDAGGVRPCGPGDRANGPLLDTVVSPPQ